MFDDETVYAISDWHNGARGSIVETKLTAIQTTGVQDVSLHSG